MVRLKVYSEIEQYSVKLLFQFHMVRLKADRYDNRYRNLRISIPHGTIKRMKNRVLLLTLDKFQFHMVRLKVLRHRIRFYRPEFQFHMVRLKGHRATRFQFVNLISIPHGTIKRVVECNRVLHELISIPHGTIKRQTRLRDGIAVADFNSTWYD